MAISCSQPGKGTLSTLVDRLPGQAIATITSLAGCQMTRLPLRQKSDLAARADAGIPSPPTSTTAVDLSAPCAKSVRVTGPLPG